MNLLDSAQADSCVRGALNLERRGDGWIPLRFTNRQLALHADAGEGRRIRTECAAGVSLRFVTDSSWIDLEFECLGAARPYLEIDIEVDGQCLQAFRSESFEGNFRKRILDMGNRPRRMREIVVHLPAATIVLLKEIGLEDGCELGETPRKPGRLLCLGDSITQGMSAISPFSTYTVQLARLLNAELLNQGIGGHVFDADTLDPTPGFESDMITVAYGTNDWTRGINEKNIQANAAAYVERLRELFPQATIWVVSPLWRSTAEQFAGGGLQLRTFGQTIREAVVATQGVRAVDGYMLVPHDELFFVDGIHPNELGFMHYAVNLYRHMRR